MLDHRTNVIQLDSDAMDRVVAALQKAAASVPARSAEPLTDVEERAETFVESVQKLTYFLITASVAIIALELKFATDNAKVGTELLLRGAEAPLLISSITFGCLSAGLSIESIRLMFRSSAKNLQYLYAKKKFYDLSEREQKEWDRVNRWRRITAAGALYLLITEVFVGLAFLVAFVLR